MKTEIIHTFSESTINEIETELKKSSLEWAGHYLLKSIPDAPLRHGQSIYLKSIHVLNYSIIVDNSKKFSRTLAAVSKITKDPETNLARSFWHKLSPGQRIDIHTDADDGKGYFSRVNRYLLFPEMPNGFITILDQKLWNYSQERNLNNSLLKFNHLDWHFFANYTSDDAKFLVLDFFKEGSIS